MSIEAKQVYEWVKTGHWSKRQFMEWLAATEESSATQEPVGFYDAENKDLRREIPMGEDGDWWQPVYTHPQPKAEQEPKREPLTDERINQLLDGFDSRIETAHMNNDLYDVGYLTSMRGMFVEFCAAHGIKGEA